MNRYENGKIYKLVNDVDGEIYVGSTCLDLAKRLYTHRHAPCFYYGGKKTPVYEHMDRIGKEAMKIILVEMFPCKNKMELEQRERYWIDKLEPSLNKCKPQRTREEKANYMKSYNQKYKQTDKYKSWRTTYDKTEKGKAGRARQHNNEKFRKQLDQMEAAIKRYESVKPIEIQVFKLC